MDPLRITHHLVLCQCHTVSLRIPQFRYALASERSSSSSIVWHRHIGGSWWDDISPQDPLRISPIVYALTPGGSSGDSQGILRGISGDSQGNLRGSSGDPQGIFRGFSGDSQGILRGDPQGILRGSSIVWHRQNGWEGGGGMQSWKALSRGGGGGEPRKGMGQIVLYYPLLPPPPKERGRKGEGDSWKSDPAQVMQREKRARESERATFSY